MKFDKKGETRNETPSRACAQKSNMFDIGRRAKQTSSIVNSNLRFLAYKQSALRSELEAPTPSPW